MNKEQLGLACWGLRELPLSRQLAMAGNLGVHEMEFSIANAPKDYPLSMSAADIAYVRKSYEDAGLPLRYVVTGNDFTQYAAAAVENDVQKVKRVIDLTKALGAQTLRIFAGFTPAAEVVGERFTRMAAALTDAARHAEKQGVTLAVELHGCVAPGAMGCVYTHSVTTQADTLHALLDAVPHSVQLLMDPANLWAVGVTDPERYYRLYRDRIAYIHLKDFVPLPDGTLKPAACGESRMNLAAFLKEADDFDGALMMEYENPEDVERGMRACLQYVTELI